MVLFGAIRAAWAPTADQLSRFGALLAIILGVIVIEGFALAQHADVANAVLVGIFAGASASGLYDAATSGASAIVHTTATTLGAILGLLSLRL